MTGKPERRGVSCIHFAIEEICSSREVCTIARRRRLAFATNMLFQFSMGQREADTFIIDSALHAEQHFCIQFLSVVVQHFHDTPRTEPVAMNDQAGGNFQCGIGLQKKGGGMFVSHGQIHAGCANADGLGGTRQITYTNL